MESNALFSPQVAASEENQSQASVLKLWVYLIRAKLGKKMWKLKLSEGINEPWVRSLNNHVGRQFWEFEPNLGTPEEQAQVEKLRNDFTKNRFQMKHSSDLLMRLQVINVFFFFFALITSNLLINYVLVL